MTLEMETIRDMRTIVAEFYEAAVVERLAQFIDQYNTNGGPDIHYEIYPEEIVAHAGGKRHFVPKGRQMLVINTTENFLPLNFWAGYSDVLNPKS